MTYQDLENWYEDQLESGISDIDFDNLMQDPEDELYNFGISRSRNPEAAQGQLIPVLQNMGSMADHILDSRALDDEFESLGDLKVYSRAIKNNFKKDTALALGSEVAAELLRSERSPFQVENPDAIDFLRDHNFRRLNALKGVISKQTKAFRILFGDES